jgi:hypothetical protein
MAGLHHRTTTATRRNTALRRLPLTEFLQEVIHINHRLACAGQHFNQENAFMA